MSAPVVILSPHPDDAVLGCWSVLEGADAPVHVVNVFAEIPPAGTRGGWDNECGVPDSTEMMRRRRAEDERVLAGAGAAAVAHLPFLDSQYDDAPRDVEQIAAAIRLAVPQWSALYAPAGTGGFLRIPGTANMTLAPHPDHEAVRAAALLLDRPGVPLRFYAELPYALGGSPNGPWTAALARFTAALEAATARRLRLEVLELPGDSAARRWGALDGYATQLPRLDEGLGGVLNNADVLRREAYWS